MPVLCNFDLINAYCPNWIGEQISGRKVRILSAQAKSKDGVKFYFITSEKNRRQKQKSAPIQFEFLISKKSRLIFTLQD